MDERDEEEQKEELDTAGVNGAGGGGGQGEGGRDEQEAYPLQVVYCGVCGLPLEYCEYGPGATADCRAWAEANHPELLNIQESMAALEVKDERDEGTRQEGGGAQGAGGGEPKKKGKKVKIAKPSKKGAGSVEQRVVIGRLSRNKRKFVTVVDGLDTFPDVKIKDAAKKIGRQFACGSSVSKAPSGAEEIVIQGDVLLDLPEFLETTFNIPASKISVIPT